MNLQKSFKENIKILQEQAKIAQEKQPIKQDRELSKTQKQAESKPKIPTIGGVKLTPEQWQTLKDGDCIFLENMINKDTKAHFSSYVFLNDEKTVAFFSKENPDNLSNTEGMKCVSAIR